MLRRFIQIGDLHLGPKARNEDRLKALADVITEQAPGSVAAFLWPGDLNDGRMTITDKNALTHAVQTAANIAPMVICYGNHDLPGDLDFLARLKAVWPIYVVSRPTVLYVQLAAGGGDAAIFVLPYPTRAGLVAAGTAPGDVTDVAKVALKTIFLNAAAKMAVAATKGFVPLVIGHVNVAGSIMSAGQPNIGKEIELDEALLQLFPHTFIGLNHIHKAQEIAGAVYAGSLCRLDWSEIDPKSYLEITYGPSTWGGYTGDGPQDGIPGWYTFDWCRKPVDVPPMYLVNGDLTREVFRYWIGDVEHCDQCEGGSLMRDSGNAHRVCGACGYPGSWIGADVRVRFRFNAVEKSLLNFDLVKAPFAGARRVDTDPVAVRDRATRAPEVMAATSLDAKVQAYVTNTGQWTPSLEVKLAALQKPEWDALALAAVTQ